MMEESYADLKELQMALMNKWAINPNNVLNLRKGVASD